MANNPFVWGDGGKPAPFIARALHEESEFTLGGCKAKCSLKYSAMCPGNCCFPPWGSKHKKCKSDNLKKQSNCKAGCHAEEQALLAEAEDKVYGNGGNGGGNGWDEELAIDLAEAEAELQALKDQLLAGRGGNGNGGNGGGLAFGGAGGGETNWGTIAAIGGILIGIVVMVMMYKKKKK